MNDHEYKNARENGKAKNTVLKTILTIGVAVLLALITITIINI